MRNLSSSGPQARRVLVTGTVAYDHLFSYPATFLEDLRNATALEVLSVSFYTHKYAKRRGGTGANMAWNLRLLGTSPLLVANVGMDGEEYVAYLREHGIDTDGVAVHPTELTSTGVCCTDTRQHQIWFFHRGADKEGAWPDLSAQAGDIAYAIIGQRHSPLMLEGLRWCKRKGIPVIFDPGQEIMNFKEDDLASAVRDATGVIGNEFEWEMLGKRLATSPAEISRRIPYAIVTLAERGHVLYVDGKAHAYPRCDWQSFANPTGAGDAFRGGLLTGLIAGWTLEEAGMLGAAIASFVVEQDGTLLENIDLGAVRERAERALGKSLPPL